jgi:hypothetical protein
VEGFRDAQATLTLAKNEKAASPSAEMARKVFYASQTTTNLIMRYRQLAALYSTDEELAFLYDDAISSNYEIMYKSDRERGWLKKNFANESAYHALKQSINVKDLKQLQKDFDSYMETVPDGTMNHIFDRSPDSPLL